MSEKREIIYGKPVWSKLEQEDYDMLMELVNETGESLSAVVRQLLLIQLQQYAAEKKLIIKVKKDVEYKQDCPTHRTRQL